MKKIILLITLAGLFIGCNKKGNVIGNYSEIFTEKPISGLRVGLFEKNLSISSTTLYSDLKLVYEGITDKNGDFSIEVDDADILLSQYIVYPIVTSDTLSINSKYCMPYDINDATYMQFYVEPKYQLIFELEDINLYDSAYLNINNSSEKYYLGNGLPTFREMPGKSFSFTLHAYPKNKEAIKLDSTIYLPHKQPEANYEIQNNGIEKRIILNFNNN